MPMMLNLEKELIRISPKNGKHIEYSLNQGQTWYLRFQGYQTGVFYDIADGGKELLATTENGLFYSLNRGMTWYKRGGQYKI